MAGKRRTLAGLAFAFGALALAAPASAAVSSAGGFKYVTKSKQFAAPAGPTYTTLSAPCPDGTHAYGGGHYNDRGFGIVQVAHSGPGDAGDRGKAPDDLWRAVFRYEDDVRIRVYAVCARPMPTYERKRVVIEAGFTADPRPRCRNGGEGPVSGGSAGIKGLRHTSSVPDPVADRWAVVVENPTTKARPVEATAICASLDLDYVTSGAEVVGPGSQLGHDVDCPADTHVVGGGQNYAYGEVRTVASRPIGLDPADGDAWQAYLDNYTAINRGFQVHATCAQPLNG